MGDNDNRDPLFDYLGGVPRKLGWRHIVSRKFVGVLWNRTWYLLQRPFIFYGDTPVEPKPLPEPQNALTVMEEHLDLAKSLESSASRRREVLEQKADRTLGVLVFLAPLFVSVVTYVSREPGQAGVSVVVLFSLTGAGLIAGFVAAFRAVGIRYSQKLGIKAVFDPTNREWLDLPRQKYARGLIWCAAWNEAINDHVADFVRSARFYTIAGMFFLIAASLPILLNQIHSPQTSKHQLVCSTVPATKSQELIPK